MHVLAVASCANVICVERAHNLFAYSFVFIFRVQKSHAAHYRWYIEVHLLHNCIRFGNKTFNPTICIHDCGLWQFDLTHDSHYHAVHCCCYSFFAFCVFFFLSLSCKNADFKQHLRQCFWPNIGVVIERKTGRLLAARTSNYLSMRMMGTITI